MLEKCTIIQILKNSLNVFSYYHVVSRIMIHDIYYRQAYSTYVLGETIDNIMMQLFVY